MSRAVLTFVLALAACSRSEGAIDAGPVDLGPDAGLIDLSSDLAVLDAGPTDGGGVIGGGTCANPYVIDVDAVTTVEEFDRAYAEAWCDWSARCAEDLFGLCDLRVPRFGVTRATLDVAEAQACLHVLVDRGCDFREFADPQSCARARVDIVRAPNGSVCEDDDGCVSGYCGSGTGGCGACAPRRALGDRCSRNRDCVDGTICLVDRCAVLVGVGEPCLFSTDCELGLACFANACAPQHDDGGSCEEAFQCAPPLVCDGAHCGVGLAEGAACEDGGVCAAGLRCSLARPRVCRPLSPPGCECAVTDDCAGGVCFAGICSLQPDVGESCAPPWDRECLWGACVDGVCTTVPEGQVCSHSEDCGPDLQCLFDPPSSTGACTRFASEGQACGHLNCGPDLRCFPTGGIETCLACRAGSDAGIGDAGVPDAG